MFNQPLVGWNTSAVTSLLSTFHGALNFNQPLHWDTSSVTSMESTFRVAPRTRHLTARAPLLHRAADAKPAHDPSPSYPGSPCARAA